MTIKDVLAIIVFPAAFVLHLFSLLFCKLIRWFNPAAPERKPTFTTASLCRSAVDPGNHLRRELSALYPQEDDGDIETYEPLGKRRR